MKRNIILLIIFFMVVLGNAAISNFDAVISANRAGSLSQISPVTCPSSGCAAGQRLNFELEFPVQPANINQINTLVCFSSQKDGISGSDVEPWANFSTGWVSSTGLISQKTYTIGDVNSTCATNLPSNESLLTSVAATLNDPINEKLQIALRINKTTDVTGDVKAYIYELASDGYSWILSNSMRVTIPVSQPAQSVYIAGTTTQCGSFSPCLVNSSDDLPSGLGTGLKDAIDAYPLVTEIKILDTLPLKSQTVIIDHPQRITGFSNASISYSGNICTNSMIEVTSGATIDHLRISDGSCSEISRNLITINSNDIVTIESNTLTDGNDAIVIKDNNGDVLIRFNQISNNNGYGIRRELGSLVGSMNIIANNIYNNQLGIEVDCQSKGHADHNYWGPDTLPTDVVANCIINVSKRLGAPIASLTIGVDASFVNVTSTKTAYFNNRLALRHISGSNFNVYIVNHGNGSNINIPFLNSGAGSITACSNFYDVFVADGQLPTDLVLSFKYDLNSSCTSIIESANYCGQSNTALLPLWWFDPATNKTDGWDKTGDTPKGSISNGTIGQVTSCDMDANELSVTIDATGHPNITTDLSFIPLVVGIPLPNGVELTSFTGDFLLSKVDLRWVTAIENSISGFHILRADTLNGTYIRISDKIPAIGNAFLGGIYNFSDTGIVLSRNYYYKLEVVNNIGTTIETYGPLSLVTATATPTATPTRTITPTFTNTPYQTNTPYVYKSPTRFVPSITPTSRAVTSIYKSPTPFLTNQLTSSPSLPIDLTNAHSSATSDPDMQFATLIIEDLIASMTATFAQGGSLDNSETTPTPQPTLENEPTQPFIFSTKQLNNSNRYQSNNWWIIMIGAVAVIIFLIFAGWLFFKSRLP